MIQWPEEAPNIEELKRYPIDPPTINGKEIKYCQIGTSWQRIVDSWVRLKQNQIGYRIMPSGLLQWLRCLHGDQVIWENNGILRDTDDNPHLVEEYDIIHINLTGDGLNLPYQLRKEVTGKTKILLNIDYGIDLWKDTTGFHHIDRFLDTVDKADIIFAVEPRMQELLEMELKRPVHLLPHPVDVEGILQWAVKPHRRINLLGGKGQRALIMVHRYDRKFYFPAWAVRDVDVSTAIIGVEPNDANLCDFTYNWTIPRGDLTFEMLLNYELKYGDIPGGLFPTSYLAIDTASYTAFGRFSSEAACLGVPIVGQKCHYATEILWPETSTERLDPATQRKMVKQLVHDQDFYNHVIEYAWEKVQQFSLDNSQKNMLKLFQEE